MDKIKFLGKQEWTIIFVATVFLVAITFGGIRQNDIKNDQRMYDNIRTQKAVRKVVGDINKLVRPMRQTQRAICRQTIMNAKAVHAKIVIDTTKLLMFDQHFQDSIEAILESYEYARDVIPEKEKKQ